MFYYFNVQGKANGKPTGTVAVKGGGQNVISKKHTEVQLRDSFPEGFFEDINKENITDELKKLSAQHEITTVQ